MRQELTKEEWGELTEEQQSQFNRTLGSLSRHFEREMPTIGELIEFLHSTGYEWEIDFYKRKVVENKMTPSWIRQNEFGVGIREEGPFYHNGELISGLWKAVKETLLIGKEAKDEQRG